MFTCVKRVERSTGIGVTEKMIKRWKSGNVTLYCGDCRIFLKRLNRKVTTVVTDPPYGLSFMGKAWDHGVPGKQFWQKIRRVCFPGAPLLAFGGTRTHHRLIGAIEDAEWEIRDCLMWLYGVGFPKSHDIGKKVDGWNGYGTALKPAWEPICLAMNPLDGTFAANALTYGVAGLNVDGCRVPAEKNRSTGLNKDGTRSQKCSEGWDRPWKQKKQRIESITVADVGRWPANVIHDGSDEVVDGFPTSKDGVAGARYNRNQGYNENWGEQLDHKSGFGGSGSASRFFYCAKASKRERNAGCKNLKAKRVEGMNHSPRENHGEIRDGIQSKNDHPTVKPLALMEYLIKLVTMPKRNLILDPFMGSGSTGVACVRLGLSFIGIDNDPKSYAIAKERVREAQRKVV